jgi:aquaporin Z
MVMETAMSFAMMLMVLITSNHQPWARYTGVVAGIFVMVFVIVSAPVSGFSINPARTLASAIPAGIYDALWIYLTAPCLGMLAATELFLAFHGHARCAKFFHTEGALCIFKCGYCRHQEVK